jgi:hypothetical protein
MLCVKAVEHDDQAAEGHGPDLKAAQGALINNFADSWSALHAIFREVCHATSLLTSKYSRFTVKWHRDASHNAEVYNRT